MNKKRLGSFIVSDSLVDNPKFPEVLAALRFVPYKVEYLYHRNGFEYLGYSPAFDVVAEGCETPRYSVSVDWVDNYPNGPGKRLKVWIDPPYEAQRRSCAL